MSGTSPAALRLTTSDELHQIGAVAERVGLSLRTIRHYDDVGLVTPTGRSAGGFRLYTTADIDQLTLVKDMKPLGFTLSESHEVLELLGSRRDGSASVDQLVRLGELAERARAQCADQRDRLDRAEAVIGELTWR